MKTKNILIVGANGLLGGHLVEQLSMQHTVYALIRENSIPHFKSNQNTRIIQCDLHSLEMQTLPAGIDAIYYLAQSDRFRDFPGGTADMMEINVDWPIKLASWAMHNGVKVFVYASSGGIYTGSSLPYKESSIIDANITMGFYPSTKLAAEVLLKNFAHCFDTFVMIRPFFMYGTGQNRSMLIPRLIDNVRNRKEILLNSAEGIRINPIYVTDAAKAVARILELSGNHVINVAGNEVVSLKAICRKIGDILSEEPLFQYSDASANDIIGDTEAMHDKLLIPSVTIAEGLQKMVEAL